MNQNDNHRQIQLGKLLDNIQNSLEKLVKSVNQPKKKIMPPTKLMSKQYF